VLSFHRSLELKRLGHVSGNFALRVSRPGLKETAEAANNEPAAARQAGFTQAQVDPFIRAQVAGA